MNKLLNLFPAKPTRNHPCQPLASRWLFSLLLDFNFIARKNQIYMDDIFTSINLPHLCDTYQDISKKKLRQEISKQRELMGDISMNDIDPVVMQNMESLRKALSLNSTEKQLLLFLVVLKSHPTLAEATDELNKLTFSGACSVLSDLLSLEYHKVTDAFSPHNILRKSGLVSITASSTEELNNFFLLISGFAGQIMAPHNSVMEMLKDYFQPAKACELSLSDFPHISGDVKRVRDYLTASTKARLKGINILLYGKPGTGKTELAGLLAKLAGKTIYNITSVDEDGEEISGNARFNAFQLGQQVLNRQKKSMILFDEIEDVFPSNFSDIFSGGKQVSKAWVNQLLENTHVPAIWISNTIDLMDKAYIRRFDLVMEIKTPPRSIRKKILKKYLPNTHVADEWIEEMSANPDIAPAIVSRSAKIANLLDKTNRSKHRSIEKDMQWSMSNTLIAMGYDPISTRKNQNPNYSTAVLNASTNLEQLIKGLEKHQQARICLYGPPGSGKTQFGHHVAKKLDKPLLVKRASDLLDKYIGETEKRLAAMFAEAEKEQAILLLDEADSFLQERKSASRQWQITQVNELLTRMENFEGIFICTTNLIERLDTASLRRFDLKIELDYMKFEQAQKMFQLTLKTHGVHEKKSKTLANELQQLNFLTPGDFATVVRKNKFTNQSLNSKLLLEGLKQEIQFKSDTQKKPTIDFTAPLH